MNQEDPEEPKLDILNVDLIGNMYTIKLALHYLRRQHSLNKDSTQDTCLILQGSLAGYLDLPGALQYAASKYGLRGVMKSLRRTEGYHNVRVNYIAPWFIRTPIMSEVVVNKLSESGIEFATVEDAAAGLLRIVSDPKVHGKHRPGWVGRNG